MASTVYFANPGHLDLDTIRMMGVSVKLTDNPIGYFGTGMKYAIATLLRHNQRVRLAVGDDEYEFTKRAVQIRGEIFQVVFMGEEKLGFTIDLGKNWKVWQAFRELYANCMDEEGEISGRPLKADTVWKISGEEIMEAYHGRAKIFLQSDPAWTIDGLEIHRGESQYLYYRGVRVYQMPQIGMFTYNFLMPMTLTEDRTLNSIFDANYKLSCRVPMVPDKEYARKILTPRDTKFFDTDLDFNFCSNPSEEFLDTVEEMKNHAHLNAKALGLLKEKRQAADALEEVMTGPVQETTIREALEITRKLRAPMARQDFKVVRDLGPGVYGRFKNGEIYIAEQTISNGKDFLAITLFEEWLHKHLNLDDMTRAMQQFLFDKILELVKEI